MPGASPEPASVSFDNSRWSRAVTGAAEEYRNTVILVCVLGASMLLHTLVYSELRKWAPRAQSAFVNDIVKSSQWPMFYLFPTSCWKVGWRLWPFADAAENEAVQQVFTVLVILEAGWLSINGLRAVFASLVRQNKWVRDPAKAASRTKKPTAEQAEAEQSWNRRKVITQLRVMKRLCYGGLFCAVAGAVVGTFHRRLDIWLSVLASTAGITFGIAASPWIKSMISSLTIAIAQPITLDDNVAIKGESGAIEEIKSQYVVHRLWDGRRLIHPISDFTSVPFENRTKTTAWKIGVILFYLDPLIVANLGELRSHLAHILAATEPANKLWDKKVVDMKVTDMKPDGTVEVRILASAAGVAEVANLKNTVRELMHLYTVEKWPRAFVRSRCEARTFANGSSWERSDDSSKE